DTNNTGAPLGFTLYVSKDGKDYQAVADEVDYKLQEAPAGSPLRVKTVTWQSFTFSPCNVRFVMLAANRLRRGGTSFYCSPIEPYQLRVGVVSGGW
ncbi:MAG: hypothetical protein WCL39_08425, partial [Armatimonadota bacterium]